MDKTLLEPLNKLEASLNSLVQSLVTTNTFSAAPKAAKDLVAADDELTSALITLKRHQDNYAAILRLRTEAETLNQNIKDTIQTCVTLRSELGNIHPHILEDSDDDDDEEEAEKYNTVDYETLLAFASRIGKHNAIARKDAEKEAERADIDARRKNRENAATTSHNGPQSNTTQQQTTTQGEQEPLDQDTTNNNNTQHRDLRTQQVENVLRQMRHLQRITHMEQSAPYPDANLLRIGELGRVHYFRELEGEQAADRMVQDMVKKAELKATDKDAEEVKPSRDSPGRSRQDGLVPRVQQPSRPVERKPKKAFDVDFPGGDEDDEEDD